MGSDPNILNASEAFESGLYCAEECVQRNLPTETPEETQPQSKQEKEKRALEIMGAKLNMSCRDFMREMGITSTGTSDAYRNWALDTLQKKKGSEAD